MSDYISRKMVMKYLQEQQANVIIEKAKHGFVSEEVCDGMKAAVDAFMNFIVQAPSEEAIPVIEGEWIYENYTWHCGKCGFHPFKGYIPKEPGFNFCPNCGAKMEGGAE